MSDHEFDRATRVEAARDGVSRGTVHAGWDIGGNTNGGYLLALAAQAMRTAAGRPDPITLTAHYLTPAPAGEAEIATDVIKEGRRFATVTGSLRQGGAERIRVMGTFGDLSRASADSPEYVRGAPPELPAFVDSLDRAAADGTMPVAIMERLKLRLHPEDGRFNDGVRSGRPVMRGWFAFADDRPIDTLALLLACDAFPPTVFNLDLAPGWVPTIELTVHVRGVPAPGPVACRFETRFLLGGMFEADGEVWDSSGRLVAQSRQLALAPRT